MRKTVILFVFVIICYQGYSQLIDNKINVYFGYNLASFSGQKVLNEKGFISPSLFSNYHSATGESIKGLMKLNQYCSIGLGLDVLSASRWENPLYNDYNGSTINLYAISPTINIHTKLKGTGIANRFKLFTELAPSIGQSNVKLSKSIFDLQSQSSRNTPPNSSNDTFIGAKWSAGLEVAINQFAGVFYTFSMQQNFINSKLYNDNHFFCTKMDFGLFLKFKKEKRYFY